MIKRELGSVCSRLSSGKSIRAENINPIGAYPVIGGNGLRGYTDSYNFDGECAVIGRQGAACGNVRYHSGKAYMTEHAIVVCANDENDTRYLSYLLSIQNLGRLSAQSAQPGISVKTLSKQEVCLPPLDEQKRVSQLLGTIDSKINANTKLNDYLAELRNTLVKERISSALEHGIGNWRVVSLKDVAQIQSGYSYKSAELVAESSIGMLGIKNFNRNGSFRSDGFKPLKPEKAKSAQYVALGEIVVAHTDLTQNADIIGRAIQVIDSGGYDQMVASLDLVKVTSSDDSISNEFLAALLSTEDFHNHCLGYVNGTTVLHLGKKALPEYQLKIPEDMAIMSELDDAFKSIAQQQAILIRESRHLERIRDALLPKLISGDIDVSKIEVSTPSNNHLADC